MYKYVNEAKTILKLFQCFISPCATGFSDLSVFMPVHVNSQLLYTNYGF